MKSLKGFVEIGSLISNVADSTAPIGEITTYGETFTRDKGTYMSSVFPDLKLISVSSKNNGVSVEVDPEIVSSITAFTNAFIALNINPITSNDSAIATLTATFNSISDSSHESNVAFGETQTATNTGNTLSFLFPIWMSYNYTKTNGEITFIKIWYCGSAYENEYDEHEIVVISPLEVNINVVPTSDFLNIFVDGTKTQQQLVDLSTGNQTDLMRVITDRTARKPYTVLKTVAYPFYYGGVLSQPTTINQNWTYIIYGPAGDNDDAIKEATRLYIAAHTQDPEGLTTYSQAWLTAAPDIFTTTEYILLPRWDLKILDSSSVAANMVFKSLSVASNDWVRFYNLFGQDITYLGTTIKNNTGTFSLLHKGLTGHVCGSTVNRNSTPQLTTMFPDFSFCNTADPIYQRLSMPTQNLILALHYLIEYADTVTPTQTLADGYYRLTRTIAALTSTVDGVVYNKPVISNAKFIATKVTASDGKDVNVLVYCRDQS